ncbi:HprK-related kinase A [uncultured Porticoccus sp.]|uniref:HprK-related kinase A n=1 Tax=uncultured Porticoccus sp. TaxID=1256050 RepID=UPI0030DB7BF3
MLLSSIPPRKLKQQLSEEGINLKIGPFVVNLSSTLPKVAENLSDLYGAYTLEDSHRVDFHIALQSPSIIRRWIRPQAIFSFDGHLPFKPLPQTQSFAMFEWGLNWCVANNAHQYLVIHSAVVEKNGKAIIFPGTPGSGKSTLCAGLVSQGWRLLSDEMALLSTETGLITPIPRPISLKNESIDIVRSFANDDIFVGTPVHDTAKGSVAHMCAPTSSVARSDEPAMPAAIIFPKYRKGANIELSPLSKGRTFIELAENSFNYHILGSTAFSVLTAMLDQCECFRLSYHNLDDAYATLGNLIDA